MSTNFTSTSLEQKVDQSSHHLVVLKEGFPVLSKVFVRAAGLSLLVPALAKIYSGTAQVPSLSDVDPVFGVPFRYLFFSAGIIEVGVALVCLFSRKWLLSTLLVAFLAANLLLYRVVLLSIGWTQPCKCMGNMVEALRISPETADLLMKLLLGCLLTGSLTALSWMWIYNNRNRRSHSEDMK